MTARVIRHVVVRGRVQGVGFRAFVEHQAQRHAIEGWVRNRRDGTVEAVFAGSPEQVETMLEACREGPPSSHVHSVEDRPGTKDEVAMRGGEMFSCLDTK
jgi:acylphosphatase